jgi:hypothetical protein
MTGLARVSLARASVIRTTERRLGRGGSLSFEPMPGETVSVPFQRVRTWMTILDAVEPLPQDLVDALTHLTDFEDGNGPALLVPAGPATCAVVWRGYLTGGVATVYEHLSPLVDRHALAALFGDDRIEVHVRGGTEDATVIAPMTDPLTVDRMLWEQRLQAACEPDDLAHWFLLDRMREQAEEVLEGVRAAERQRPEWIDAAPPDAQLEVPPGVVDLALLAVATFHLVESYTSDGLLDDAIVECRAVGGRWRTDVHAPCIDSAPGDDGCDTWRLVQWHRDHDGVEPDRWVLDAREDVDLGTVVGCLPPDLRSWAERRTRDAIALLDELVDDPVTPSARDDRDRLRCELDALADH